MLLLLLVCIPFFFGVLCWQSEQISVFLPRWIALLGMSIVFVITLFLLKQEYVVLLDFFKPVCVLPQWNLEYLCVWIPRFGINFHLALDGLSLLMVILSGFLGCVAVLCSWYEIKHYPGLFYLNLLWITGGVMGVFLSIDMFLFFFFWEIMIIPMYFLISLWGHVGSHVDVRVSAATKFFIYSQLSGLCLLICIIVLVSINYSLHGIWSFSYQDLLSITLPNYMEYFLMLGFFFAFALKMPIVPFHVWLPDAHSQAPTAGSVDLSGMVLKTAAYGFFRFILPMFPYASQSFAPFAMLLGILSIFYGSWMAFAQDDIKRFIAYASISHMGLILFAIYGGNKLSYQGAVVQMIAHSISTSGMFILCGQLYERLNTRNMYLMGGGLWSRMKLMPAFSLCFAVAMLGLPGTGNFIGEVIILLGNFQVAPIMTVIAAFGIIFSTLYSLIFMQRVYYGPVIQTNRLLKDMTVREKFIIIILLLCLFSIGFFPQFILNASYLVMNNIQIRLEGLIY